MKQYVKIGIEFKDEFDADFCIFMKFLETNQIKDYNNNDKLQIFTKTNAWEIWQQQNLQENRTMKGKPWLI